MSKTVNNMAIGKSWDEVEDKLFTPEEIAQSNLRVSLIGKLIKARKEANHSKNRKKKVQVTGKNSA